MGPSKCANRGGGASFGWPGPRGAIDAAERVMIPSITDAVGDRKSYRLIGIDWLRIARHDRLFGTSGRSCGQG